MRIFFVILISFSGYCQQKYLPATTFISPIIQVEDIRLTSQFGLRMHPVTKSTSFHNAIDIAAPSHTEVYASSSGVVKKIDFDVNLGIYVVIAHQNKIESLYGHLFAVCVEVGQEVVIGEHLGFVGKTGRATGFHLHFGIKKENQWMNPIDFMLGNHL